jgi:hypothetical protein
MLRWTLGDKIFFNAIQNYLKDVKLAGGFAKTPDLIHAFEDASGKNLSKFFDQWYYKQGYPIYDIKLNQSGDGSIKKLTVYQTQSKSSVNFFEMAIPIQFFIGGKDTIIRFEHSFSGEIFNINLIGKVDSIKFDPELWLISKNNKLSVATNEVLHVANNFEVYPNPGTAGFYISSKDEIIDQINFVDQLGKSILTQNIGLKGSYISTESLNIGTYIILIQTSKGLFSKKWIKD